jgi:quinol-cytochrome oxidoreductase complex cytochrome b subunit
MGLARRAAEALAAWVEDRVGLFRLGETIRKAIRKPVPRRLSWYYTMGSLAMFLFAVQFLTGFLLLTNYVPDADSAYRSVAEIQNHVPLGWLVRQMHSWGASFVVVVLLVHMLKVLWYGGYKAPREATWFLGVILFLIALTFCFTGYLLPWNQLARWATAVGTDAVGKLPGIGDFLGGLVRGGPEVTGQTLGRFFAVHVFVLPLTLSAFLAAHLALVQKHGISTHLRVDEERAFGYRLALERAGGSEPFFPRQVYRDLLVINLGFAALVLAAAFLPWKLGEPAGESTPEHIKPEWYFLPVYQLLKYFDAESVGSIPLLGRLKMAREAPEVFGIVAINLAGMAFLLLPLLDRSRERAMGKRPLFAAIASVSIVGLALLGVLGHFSGEEVEIFGARYRFSIKGYPERVAGPAAAVAQAASPAGGPPAAAAAESSGAPARGSPADEAAGQCGLCHRHSREIEKWKQGVHARGANPASACVNCHGGDPRAEDKDEAHRGILTRETRGRVRARHPEGKEVVEICGKCHAEVAAAFSARHLDEEPARVCSGCHSNHQVEPAGPAIFENGYREGDPRAPAFLAIRGRAVELEQEWQVYQDAAGTLLEKLRAREAPIKDFEEDLQRARDLRREARVLTHSLDPKRVGEAVRGAVEAMRKARGSLEEGLRVYDRRGLLAVGIGSVPIVFAGLLGLALRRLGR